MDLFKLFRPREAATFAAEPINPVVLPGADACNCPDVLFSGNESAEIKSLLSGDNDSKRRGHKIVSDKIDSILFGGDKQTAASQLAQIQRTQPAPNPGEETKRHLLMHMDGAGKSNKDYGIGDSELSPKYVAGRQLAEQAQSASVPTDYDADNCGTCAQFESALKNHANKLSTSMEIGQGTVPYVGGPLSPKGAFQRLWDSWTNKKPVADDDHPLVKEGNNILNNWNNHTETGHGFSIDPYNFVKHTPMLPGTEGGKARMHKLYDKLQAIGTGWSMKRRLDIPEKGISEDTERQLSEMYPQRPDQDVTTRGILPRVTPEENRQALELAETMKERGELNQYVLADETPTPRATNASEPQVGISRDKPTGRERTMFEIHPTNYDFGGAPVTPSEVFETENLTGYNRGPNYTIVKKPFNADQAYNPEVAQKNWLVRPVTYDTDRPEIIQTYTNHKRDGMCDHPSHKSAEQKASCEGLHADDINDLYSIPREDAFLFQKARVKPDLALHKENRRSMSPTAENKQKAYENYNSSYNQALATAYPGMSRDNALDALYNEHQTKINELASRTERYRTSSKKEDNMFNSSNSKEAHVDPSAVAHGIAHGVGWLMDKGRQLLHDMNNPVTHSMDKSDQATGNQIMQQAQNAAHAHNGPLQDRYMSEYTNYMDSHSQPHLNLVGAEADAAALASPFIIKKHLGSFNERFAAEKKPCPDCGKSCKDKVECKSNQDERRRQNAAENSSY